MNYKVLISENPIPSIEVADEIRAMGLLVPFVPSDPTFNIYAYLPVKEGGVRKSTLDQVHYFEDLHLEITQKELDKHFTKVEDFNHVEVGDFVKIHGYKNLVTQVERILGGRAVTKINLRGTVFRFEKELKYLSKSDVLFMNRSEDFQYCHDSRLFLDLQEFGQEDSPPKYILDVFNHLLRVKIPYPNLEVILINPKHHVDRVFGLGSITTPDITSIKTLLSKEDYLYSRDYYYFSESYTFLTKVKRKNLWVVTPMNMQTFQEETNLTTPDLYRFYVNLMRKAESNGIKFNPLSVKNRLKTDPDSLRHKHPECFLLPEQTFYEENKQDFCVENVFTELVNTGHISIAENLDYYMGIIRG